MQLSESPSRIKLSFHIVGWLVFFITPIILSPGRDMLVYFSDPGIITSLVLRNIVLMFLFYANLFYLTPRLFRPGSQAAFFITVGVLTIVVGTINYYIHEILNGPFHGLPEIGARLPRPPNPSPGLPGWDQPPRRLMLASPFFSSLLIAALVITASTLLVLWNNWIDAKSNEQERTLQKVAAELSVLKLQISPHFLFNTLNNIRWLVRSKSEHAEPALIKLSQLLRYILYQANSDFVALDREVAHLHDYIGLQKMRLPESEKISFVLEGDFQNKKIVPLLLIPLVENFFKHGDFSEGAKSAIELKVEGEKLIFKTTNKISKSAKDESIDSGIGIENVRKRLLLHYADRQTLKQFVEGDNYFVLLEIVLS